MIRKTIKGGNFKPQMIGELEFDQVPEEGSFNPVTSDAVAKIAGDVADLDAIVPDDASEENKLVSESGLQDAIDAASESWSTGFTPKGESSVSDLNELTTQSNGDSYIVTDSGTLTEGSLAVVAGDQVAWDATNEVWYKLPQYALKSDVDNISKSIIDAYYYEMGNIAMASNKLVYSSSTTRLRTKRNWLIKAKKGDMVGVNAGFQLYVAISSDGNDPYEIHGWITTWTFTSDCYVAILVRKGIGSDQDTTLEELLGNTWVRSLNSELSPFVNTYNAFNESRDSAKGGSLTFKLDGADDNLVYKRIKANKGDILQVKLSKNSWTTSESTSGVYKVIGVRKVLGGGTTQDIIYAEKQDAYWPSQFEVVVPDDAEYLDVYFRAAVGVSVEVVVEAQTNNGFVLNPKSSIIKSVNHRGFNSIAPENTLPAFRLSAKYGFGIVETDVRVTSDGYLVCIHDSTVDRTSDGTGNVADKTLADLKALDFGSWKSVNYAGTKIPTYKEFLACCKKLGLQAYVEVKALGIASTLVQETKELGMLENVTFISDNSYGILESVAAIATKSRLGLIVNDVTADTITTAQSIKTDNNEVFFDANYERLTAEGIALAIENGFGVEVYTIDNIQSLVTLDYCISGVTSNSVVASQVIYSKELNGN